MTATPSTDPATTPQPSRLIAPAATGWALALVANLLLLIVATRALGIDVVHPEPPGSDTLGAVTWVHVALSTTVGGVLALAAALLARRFTPRPRTTFLVVAGLGALISAAGPFSIPGASGASTAVLLAMHVITPAAILPPLARTLPARRAPR